MRKLIHHTGLFLKLILLKISFDHSCLQKCQEGQADSVTQTGHGFYVLVRYPVVSIQSRFDTSRFDTNRSRFDTNQKSFRYKSKVVSIQIKSRFDTNQKSKI